MTTARQNPPPLPKPRKGLHPGVIVCALVVLLLSVFLIWRLRLSSQVSASLARIKKAGEPSTARDLNRYYAEVPKDVNAALFWMKGVSELQPAYDRNHAAPWTKVKFPERGTELPQKTLQEAKEIIRANEEALKTFRVAAGLKNARYSDDLTPGYDALLPHLAQLKSVGQLLRLKAEVAAQTRKPEEATQAIATLVGAAESLKTEPILVSQLVRSSLDGMACSSLETLVGTLSLQESELEILQNAFAGEIDEEHFYRSVLGERATGITLFLGLEGSGGAPSSNSGEPSMSENMNALRGPISEVTGFLKRDLLFFLRAMETNLAVARLPDPERLRSTNSFDAIALKAKKGYYFVSALLLPGLSKAVVRDVENRARLRVAQTAMAVERYRVANGRLPTSLEVLVPQFLKSVPPDPIDGKPLRYKLLVKGYVVYSIGTDAQNDGGKPRSTKKKHQADPFDLTFTVERVQDTK